VRMADDDTLARLEAAVDSIAQGLGAGVDSIQLDGTWVVSIEPTGERHGDWAIQGDGPTKATALSNLIQNAKDQGKA
jgi:hypothetical protein